MCSFESPENKKQFPEQGVYKGQPYRIDGDSIMLPTSSGREIQIGPGEYDAATWDSIKNDVAIGRLGLLPVAVFRPSTYIFDTEGANALSNKNVDNSPEAEDRRAQEMWGIDSWEEGKLFLIGREILTEYLRSQYKNAHRQSGDDIRQAA